MSAVLTISDVRKTFQGQNGREAVYAVNGVSLEVRRGETLAVIGESGSGKSTLGRLALGLIEPDSGRVEFDGQDLAELDHRSLQRHRRRMTIVFQEPFASLNPLMTVGAIVEEPLIIHEKDLSRAERRRRVTETLEMVMLDASFATSLPASLSGGQQQRVGIARAMVTRPELVVLDEPTSSLDLSVRAQILQLLERLRVELGLAYVFISHDIHTVEYVADRVAVVYLGQVLELGPREEVFGRPLHPYTRALLSARLSPDPRQRLETVPLIGEIPSPTSLPPGCAFYGRCPQRDDPRCATERPSLREVTDGHYVASFYAGPAEARS